MPVPLNKQSRYLLESIPFFKNLPDTLLSQIAAAVIVRHYQANQMIFLEGDPFAGLHIIAEGLGKLYTLSERGREYTLMIIQAGDSCNEVPIVDNGPNPVNLAAIEETTVWIIPPQTLQQLYDTHPPFAAIINQNIAKRCRQLVKQICRLSFLSVTGRLAAFILSQSEGEPTLKRHWTQEELAASLGTAREVVSRALKELQRGQFIEMRHRRIYIIDRLGLEDMAGL